MRTSSSKSCVLALDAGGTSIKLGLVRLDAFGDGVLDPSEVPVPSDGSVEEIAAAYAEAASTGKSCAEKRGLILAGVGVSTPGPFDYETGASLMTHKYAAVRGMSIRSFIERATGPLPIRFTHDSFAFLLGELAASPRPRYRNPCAVIIGTGLGFAALRDGKLLRNTQGGPAISIYRAPFRDGIAEDYVSKRGIMACYARLGGVEKTSVKEIDLAARAGDELCARVFSESGKALAEITAPVIKEGGFDCMILGGQIAKAGPLLTVPVQRRLDELGVGCAVESALQTVAAPLLGAALLFQKGEALQ
ncbi:MAG: ROK family protein [Treponemataceae bacterium]